MGQPAARIGDPTAHGGVVTVGLPTVLIGGPPASRIGDLHTCPLVTVLVPHVGGPFLLGAFTVLTGGPPQSRQGDTLICVGPPDVCAMGMPTVLVGMAGGGGLGALLAGVMGAIGGLLGDPYPRAVLQDDGSIVTEYNEQITIEGSAEYQATVVHDLDTFTATETGQKWLDAYADTGRNITIRPITPPRDYDNGYGIRVQGDDALIRDDGTAGPGSDTIIEFNPARSGRYRGEDGNMYDRGPSDTLGHELMHGLHNGQGMNRRNQPDPHDPHDNQEEAQTIGVHGYEDDEITERALLDEDGRSARPDHDSIEESTYQDENGDWFHEYEDEHGNKQTDPIDPPADDGWRPSH